MRKLLLLFLLWGGCVSSFAQVNSYADRARLQDFARQLTGGIDRLEQQMDAFSARTGLDIYIVTAYKYNQPDISRLAAEWPQKGKGLLLGLNLHEEGNWPQNLQIAYTPEVTSKIPAEQIEQVRNLVLVPLLEGREISVADGFGGTTKVSYGGQGKYYLTLEQGIAALLAAFEGTPLGSVPAIAFAPAADARHGFDAKRLEALAQYYRKGSNEFTGKDEYIPWKAIEAGKTDVVEVVSPGRSNRAELAKVQFHSPTGSVPASRVADDRLQLTLQGGGRAEDTQEISAYYPTGSNSGYTVARLNVVTYEKTRKNLVIVPLTGTDGVPSGGEIQRVLNQIYGQAVAEWSVEVAPAFDPGAWDGNGNGQVEIGNSGLLSNYTAEMRAINRAFKNNTPAYNGDTYYLFLVNQSENAATLGYMPRAKPFGYVFTQAVMRTRQSVPQVIAHELGHGAFHLKHTFEETSVAKGSSTNVMDYPSGTTLNKYQWDLVHDPARVYGLSEGDEESQLAEVTALEQLKSFANADGSLTFISPAGLPITLPATTQSVTFATGERWAGDQFKLMPIGVLLGFTLSGKEYRAYASGQLNTFLHYSHQASGQEGRYVDRLTATAKPQKAIVGYPCLEASGAPAFVVYQKSIETSSTIDYSKNYLAAGPQVAFDYLINFYLSGRWQANPIKIAARQNLSEEAKEYLGFRKAYANCDHPLAPYVFIHAYQITYNPGTYWHCGAQADYRKHNPAAFNLDRLASAPAPGTGTPSPAGSFVNYYQEVKQWTSQLDVYKRRTEALAKLQRLKTLTDTDRLVEVLEQFERESCIWVGITLDNRKHALKKLLEGRVNDYWLNLGNNKENLFNLVLSTTPVDQRLAILEEFTNHDNQQLLLAYSKLNLGSNDEFIATLTTWLVNSKGYEVEQAKWLRIQPAIPGPDIIPDDLFVWSVKESGIGGKSIQQSNGQFYCWSTQLQRNIPLDPFAIIKVRFATNFPGDIKAGTEMVVPAIWAYRFQDNYHKQQLFTVARVLVDAAVIISTFGTGTTAVAALEIGFAATDLFIVSVQDKVLTQFDDGEAFLKAWDDIYAIYGAGASLHGIHRLALGAGTVKLTFNTKNLVSNFKTLSASSRQALKGDITMMANFLKKWGSIRSIPNWEVAYHQLIDYARTIELQTIQRSAVTAADRLVLQVRDYSKVIVFNTLLNVQIARTELRRGGPYFSNIRWLPAGLSAEARSVDAIGPIDYEGRLFQAVQRAELEIVSAQGSYYLREAGRQANNLTKLSNVAASRSISWRNLDHIHIVWVKPNSPLLHTAKTFAEERGSQSLYDLIFDNGTYAKFDLEDGRLLVANGSGEYQGFGVVDNAKLTEFKTKHLSQSSNATFEVDLSRFISENAGKIQTLANAGSKTISVAGKPITISPNKVSTFLGRFRPDIQNLFQELGSFKNVGLGEKMGGLNLLNKPDHYYDAFSWWIAYNKPWLKRAVDRADDVYLATIPQRAEDIIDLSTNQLKGAYAQELDYLAARDYRPANISVAEWTRIKSWFKAYNDRGDVFFTSVEDFAKTFDAAAKLSLELRQEAFALYKQKDWPKLEALFKQKRINFDSRINASWPPADGGYNIMGNVPLKKGMKFDRYGGATYGWNGKGTPPLGGNFTSPMSNGSRYTFGQRALNQAESGYDFYYEIEILEDLPFTGKTADVIPWFGQPGGGKQTKWDIPINPNSAKGYSYTMTELAEMGLIRITIKSSPSGKYTEFVNTVIGKN